MLSRAVFVAALAMSASLVQPASAAEVSGQAISVRQDAAASGAGGDRVLEVKGPIFSGDVIKTDRLGSAQLLFADDTRMVVGPNSQITVDAFVFKTKTTAKTFSIDALRGSFRFITGVSAKNAYSIKTPTATIGVRGTELSGNIDPDGTLTLVMWGGASQVCSNGVCRIAEGACTILIVTPQGQFQPINNVYERTRIIDEKFPFGFRQNWLQQPFRVPSSGCEIHNFDPAPSPSGGNTPDEPAPTYDPG